MTTELRPLGVKCNLGCLYCYQNPQRDAGNLRHSFDMQRMKTAVCAEGGPFTLFGGEPLLVPLDDLEEIWSWGRDAYGRNSVQTNGTLITDDHMRLFREYRVHVGISLDGPGSLNDLRWHGTVERTRAATERADRALRRLCAERFDPSLIVTLHRGNATSEHLGTLLEWIRSLDADGLRWARSAPARE